jgi:hypothetical protein
MGKAAYRNPVPHYRKVFLDAWRNDLDPAGNRTRWQLYLSPIRDNGPPRKRLLQQTGYPDRIVGYQEYLETIASSHYVLSPDGITRRSVWDPSPSPI